MRIALNNTIKYFKKQATAIIEKPNSNIIIDPYYYNQTGIFNVFYHKFKNNGALFDIRRNLKDFSTSSFEKNTLAMYRQLYSCYSARDYKNIVPLLSEDLVKKFKKECKERQKNQNLQLGWLIIEDANESKIVQARIYQEKKSTFTSFNRWFQITCKFTNSKGESAFNVLEKHEEAKQFKFVKIDS